MESKHINPELNLGQMYALRASEKPQKFGFNCDGKLEFSLDK